VFYTLYGHLSLADIQHLKEGKFISRGELLAHFGEPKRQWQLAATPAFSDHQRYTFVQRRLPRCVCRKGKGINTWPIAPIRI